MFSTRPLLTCARRTARNGEKAGWKGVGGHTGPGRVCENKLGGSYFWPNNCEICQETWVVECPDGADRRESRGKKKEEKVFSERWPRLIVL